MSLRSSINFGLEKVAHPTVPIGQWHWRSFRLCGGAGLAGAYVVSAGLMARQGLQPSIAALLLVTSALTFLTLAMARKIVTGEERLTYYHHEIAVIVVATIVLRLLREPVLPYLDATVLGIGIFLALGRIGCLMVGCCHGRPHRWGLRYGRTHVAAGFTPCFEGVRLFPLQVLESLLVLLVVLGGALIVVTGQPAGSAFAWYVIAYDAGRFCFEFMRGDSDRAYCGGFSEAQWTAAGLTLLVGAAEVFDVLPQKWWHLAAAVGITIAMASVAVARRWRRIPKHRLLHPLHIKDLAEAIQPELRSRRERGRPVSGQIEVAHTSLGVQVSTSTVCGPEISYVNYALSYRHKKMDEAEARVLARVIWQLRNCPASPFLIEGGNSVYHLLIADGSGGVTAVGRE